MIAGRSRVVRWGALATLVVAVIVAGLVIGSGVKSEPQAPAFTASVDPGTPLSGRAPDFTLTDQSGAPVSLHSLRGRVVILAFNDSECTTICPLTTTAMVSAKRLLGAAGSEVQLLGIDANPEAVSLRDVRAYSEAHGMTHDWQFLTGSLPQLRRVWRAYHIDAAIEGGEIDHTPAVYVIDREGRLAKVYLTQMSYSSVDQQARVLAQEASSLLPGHPRVGLGISHAQIPTISPATAVRLPRVEGGTVRLAPGVPRLLAFFATWDSQVTNLASALEALARYQSAARAQGLPDLSAVDEGSVEPSGSALPRFLQALPSPLPYPVAIDRSGRVADGYGVQDEPWFVLVSASGRVLWYHDISTSGWLSTRDLVQRVRAAMARSASPSSSVAARALAGSPPVLAALHQQAGQLLGTQSTISARLRGLHGYPVIVNAWASWCTPCRSEFGLFASASARYGREVAFLGVDANDSPGDARSFLTQHPVSYPSYQSSTTTLSSIAAISGLPTTLFINRAGRVVYVHTGQYEAQGTLDQDIEGYALRR